MFFHSHHFGTFHKTLSHVCRLHVISLRQSNDLLLNKLKIEIHLYEIDRINDEIIAHDTLPPMLLLPSNIKNPQFFKIYA